MASMPPSRDPKITEYAPVATGIITYQPSSDPATEAPADTLPGAPFGTFPTVSRDSAPSSLAQWPLQEAQANPGYDFSSAMAADSASSMPDEMLSWAFLQDDTIWNMEAGLGRYVYGEPSIDPDMLNGFHFNF
jgi:hypothetical protein